jgi:hypothetical protein
MEAAYYYDMSEKLYPATRHGQYCPDYLKSHSGLLASDKQVMGLQQITEGEGRLNSLRDVAGVALRQRK